MQGAHALVRRPPGGPDLPPSAPAAAVLGATVGALVRLVGVRVLVVDDDADARDLRCVLVTMAGGTALCVESVARALEAVLHSFDPDVVVTDYCMPGADGTDLIREFRKLPSTRAVQVPILIVSGLCEEGWRLRVLAAGAAGVLTKPFDPADLIASVAAAVAGNRGGLRTLPS
jgi:CheY-like chemotaxis protein